MASNQIQILKYLVAETGHDIIRYPVRTVNTILIFFISLSFLGFFLYFQQIINNLSESLNSRTDIVLYIQDNMVSENQLAEDLDEISKIPGVTEAKFISKQQAYLTITREFEGQSEWLSDLERTLFPSSIELSVVSYEFIPEIISTLREKYLWLEDIDSSYGLAERTSKLQRLINTFGSIVTLIFVSATLMISSSAIRVSIYAKRREIEIMKLVGATDSYILFPFYFEGIIFGCLAGFLSSFSVYIIAGGFFQELISLFPFLEFAGSLPYNVISIKLILTGIIVGSIGSFLATRQISDDFLEIR